MKPQSVGQSTESSDTAPLEVIDACGCTGSCSTTAEPVARNADWLRAARWARWLAWTSLA